MIVLDANVVAGLMIEVPQFSEWARKAVKSDPEQVLPPLWRSEFRSVLLKLVWAGNLGVDEAAGVYRRAETRFRDLEVEPDTRRVLADAAETKGLSSYDAEYVVLAKTLGGFVVSNDQPLADLVPDHVLRLSSFAVPQKPRRVRGRRRTDS